MTDKKYDWLVIGGGFRSMIGAYALAKKGESVIIVDPAEKLGGFMTPVKWEQYWIDILNARIDAKDKEAISFEEYIYQDAGNIIGSELLKMSKKFLTREAKELSKAVVCMTTFCGRKLLYDNELSLDLKSSPFLDNMLAAQKANVQKAKLDTDRFNLYPSKTGLESVRQGMEEALKRAGVSILLETEITSIDSKDNNVRLSNGKEIIFDKVFLGCDVRESEKLLFQESSLQNKTHPVAEVMHCYEVPLENVDKAFYLVDYDQNHKSSRMTNFCNYMASSRDNDRGVVLVEQPISRESEQWNNPSLDQDTVYKEILETGNLKNDKLFNSKSFKIPVTYKAPLVGFEDALKTFNDKINLSWGDRAVCPSGTSLTRKETLDDLRGLGIL